MLGYLVRRLAVSVLIVIGATAIVFAILHYLSPTPAYTVLGTKAAPQAIASWNLQHGYDRPEATQFVSYLWGVFHGNFGYSYKLSQTVAALFGENLGRSAYLCGASLVLALIVAVPLGVLQAVKRNSPGDYAATGLAMTLYSMPAFLLGLILIQFFALDLSILPGGVSDSITSTWQAIIHPAQLCLPIVTFAATLVAYYSRYMRSSALDELAQDYIRLARAKGLAEKTVLFSHMLRNACLPMATLVGLSIPIIVAGNVLIEVLFNYPGTGLLFFNAIGNQDYNVMLAYTLLTAILTVFGNLLADVAISAADPRVRLGS